MSPSFDFHAVETLTVGTLGPRGERVFYLQCRSDGDLVSFRLEKQQVAALAEYLDRVLEDLPGAATDADDSDLTLAEPVIPAWTVGSLGVGYAADADRLIVVAEEMVDEDEADDAEPASARFALRREQVAGLVERARTIVAAGRPPCPFCARPLEPAHDGWCPCAN